MTCQACCHQCAAWLFSARTSYLDACSHTHRLALLQSDRPILASAELEHQRAAQAPHQAPKPPNAAPDSSPCAAAKEHVCGGQPAGHLPHRAGSQHAHRVPDGSGPCSRECLADHRHTGDCCAALYALDASALPNPNSTPPRTPSRRGLVREQRCQGCVQAPAHAGPPSCGAAWLAGGAGMCSAAVHLSSKDLGLGARAMRAHCTCASAAATAVRHGQGHGPAVLCRNRWGLCGALLGESEEAPLSSSWLPKLIAHRCLTDDVTPQPVCCQPLKRTS